MVEPTLSKSDCDLVARDPAISGMRTLLDPCALGQLFGAGPLDIETVRYKPGVSCLVGGSFGYAKAYAPGDDEKFVKKANAVFPERRIAIYRFPHDKELKLRKRDRVSEELRLELTQWETIRYNPERRYVARAGEYIIKFYDKESFAQALSNLQAVSECQGFRVPPLVAHSQPSRWMATRFVSGNHLSDVAQARVVGCALRRLHIAPAQALGPMNYVGNLEGSIAWLLPKLSEKIVRLKASLPKPESSCAVHGDFHSGQVLVHGEDAVFLDFDRAGLGEPAFDIGNFLAHLIRDGRSDVTEWRDALLSGYGAKVDDSRVKLMTALGLFRLVMEPFRKRLPAWDREVERLVDLAFAALPAPFYERALHALGQLPGVLETRLIRHKPGRRALIEAMHESGDSSLMKVRARRYKPEGFGIQKLFFDAGFRPPSLVCVPEPLEEYPDIHGWAQRRVGGRTAQSVFDSGNDLVAAEMLGRAAAVLQAAKVPAGKSHTLEDELLILNERLAELTLFLPPAASEIRRLSDLAADICSRASVSEKGPQHRDFYGENILIDGQRVWIIDLDLYCIAELGLDAGNFMAHMADQAFRKFGRFDALQASEDALATAYLDAAGIDLTPRVRLYRALSIARLAAISARFEERRRYTLDFLSYAIEQLALASSS